MKLATLKNGTRDGRLVVVSRDLTRYTDASFLAPTLQAALDDWQRLAPASRRAGANRSTTAPCRRRASTSTTRIRRCRAPTSGPTARPTSTMSSWCAKRAAPRCRPSFWTDPLIYQGGSDSFLGAARPDPSWPTRPGASTSRREVAVIIDDVPMGASARRGARRDPPGHAGQRRQPARPDPGRARQGFRLLPVEAVLGLFAGRGDARRARRRLGRRQAQPAAHVDYNGKPFGRANAGVDMTFDFPALIAHAAKTRPLAAGTIIGSGTVSNKLDGGPGKPVGEGGAGYSCIAEMRTIETIAARRAEDAVPALRRHGPHRDEGQGRPFDLRRHRAEGREIRAIRMPRGSER